MLKDVLSAQKTFFETGMHTELRGQVNRQRRVVLLSGNVTSNVRSDVSGVSARVYRNGTYGFSSMAEFSEEAAQRVLRAAADNAVFMDTHVPAGKPAFQKKRVKKGKDRGCAPMNIDSQAGDRGNPHRENQTSRTHASFS